MPIYVVCVPARDLEDKDLYQEKKGSISQFEKNRRAQEYSEAQSGVKTSVAFLIISLGLIWWLRKQKTHWITGIVTSPKSIISFLASLYIAKAHFFPSLPYFFRARKKWAEFPAITDVIKTEIPVKNINITGAFPDDISVDVVRKISSLWQCYAIRQFERNPECKLKAGKTKLRFLFLESNLSVDCAFHDGITPPASSFKATYLTLYPKLTI